MIVISWVFLIVSVIGFVVTFPLYMLGIMDDRQMIAITLALSWAALWYTAVLFIFEARQSHE